MIKKRDAIGLSKLLKILRIKNDETLLDMSTKLGFSATFLSAIENGKKKVPDDFEEKILKNYSLTNDEIMDLKEGIIRNNDKLDINFSSLPEEKKELALKFGRTIDSLSEEDIKRLLKILGKKGD